MAARGTLKSLRDWADKARPGDRLTYHVGGQKRSRGAFELMRDLSDEGVVLLYQRSEVVNIAMSPATAIHYSAQKLSPLGARFVTACGKGRV